jgi:hypothetical protein
MENFAQLMRRLLEIQSGGRERSPELIAEDERLMDGTEEKSGGKAATIGGTQPEHPGAGAIQGLAFPQQVFLLLPSFCGATLAIHLVLKPLYGDRTGDSNSSPSASCFIPRHGCVPAVPASVSPGKIIVTLQRAAVSQHPACP